MVFNITDGILTKAIVEDSYAHVIIPDECVRIGEGAFKGNLNITKVTLPGELREIGNNAFNGCENLQEINLDGVEKIGQYAFHRTGLRNVTLGSAAEIAHSAFEECKELESFSFPDKLLGMGWGVFRGCEKLIQLDSRANLFSHLENDTHLIVHDDCTEIIDYMFYKNQHITKITLPSSIRKIGTSAFEGCKNLQEINLDGVEEIGAWAFSGTGLHEVILGSKANIFPFAFCNCKNLESFSFPGSLLGMGWKVFGGCDKLVRMDLNGSLPSHWENDTHLVVHEGCKEIMDYMFDENLRITKVTLPSSLKKIGKDAFGGCENLREINLESVEEIGVSAFANTGLRNVTLGPAKRISDACFFGCYDLEVLSVSEAVREVGEYAFYACKKLTKLDLKNVEIVRDNAFESCTNLQEIQMPNVRSVDISSAFSDCPLIEEYLQAWENLK